MPPLNVLMVTSDANILRQGTAARSIIEEYSRLAKRLVVIVINRGSDHYQPQKVSDSLWIFPTNAQLWFLAPWIAHRIARRELFFQGKLQVDLLSAHDPLLAGLTAFLIARSFQKPLNIVIEENIFSSHYEESSILNEVGSYFGRVVLRRASSVLAASENIRASLADISAAVAGRTIVAPAFIDGDSFQREPVKVNLAAKYPQFKYILLTSAPLSPSQNLSLAISAFRTIDTQYPHAGLIIVGEGSQRKKLALLAAQLGVGGKVIFEKWNANMNSYYKTAHVVLFTSRNEEYGQSISAAAACGAAIVSTRIGMAPAIIEHGISGFLCDASDPACFITSVMKMIKDPALRERIKVNVAQFLEKHVGTSREESLSRLRESWNKAVEHDLHSANAVFGAR